MSDRREERGISIGKVVGAAVGAGILGGIGYAIFKATQQDSNPVRNAVEGFLRTLERCESCEEEIEGHGGIIKLLCNHYYHMECLRKEYERHSMMSHSPFVCCAHECFFRIPESVISSIYAHDKAVRLSNEDFNAASRPLAIQGSEERMKRDVEEKCEVCDRELEPDDIKLHCNHYYHKHCILANYILHEGAENYYCPVQSCRELVSPSIIASLVKTN